MSGFKLSRICLIVICLQKKLIYHVGYQEISRCRTRDDSEELIYTGNKAYRRGIHPDLKTQEQKSKLRLSVAL